MRLTSNINVKYHGLMSLQRFIRVVPNERDGTLAIWGNTNVRVTGSNH